MKSLGKFGLYLVVLSSLGVALGHAEGTRSNELSLRVGAAFPTSANDFNDSAKTGVLGGVRYLHNCYDRLGFGLQANYFSFSGKDRTITLPNGRLDATSDTEVVTAELVGRYRLQPGKKIAPYLIAGLGVTRFAQETDGTPMNGTTWADTGTREKRAVADDSSTGFALSGGVGLEMPLSERFLAAAEVAWHLFGVDNDEFGADAINVPSASFSVAYKF